MILSEFDIIGITIALVTSFALILTSASANARITRQRNYWRQEALAWNTEADELREEVLGLRTRIKSMSQVGK